MLKKTTRAVNAVALSATAGCLYGMLRLGEGIHKHSAANINSALVWMTTSMGVLMVSFGVVSAIEIFKNVSRGSEVQSQKRGTESNRVERGPDLSKMIR